MTSKQKQWLRWFLLGSDDKFRTSVKALPDIAELDKILNGLPPNSCRVEPRVGWVHGIFKAWLDARSEYGRSLPYPLYAIARFGVADGLWRTWEYHLHPKNAWQWLRRRWRKFRLVDRRPKTWSRTVYAIDRDGDLFLVECPRCHATQHLLFNLDLEQPWEERNGPTPRYFTETVPPKTFLCGACDIGFKVYLEDGIRQIRDHRKGVPPLPSVVVWDDNRTIHLGIAKDAPFWWQRREICRDLHDGKDAHGHKPYEIFPTESDAMTEKAI